MAHQVIYGGFRVINSPTYRVPAKVNITLNYKRKKQLEYVWHVKTCVGLQPVAAYAHALIF